MNRIPEIFELSQSKELAEGLRNPESTVAYLQIMLELYGSRLSRNYIGLDEIGEVSSVLTDRGLIASIFETNLESGLLYIEILLGWGLERQLDGLSISIYIEHMIGTGWLIRVLEQNPEKAAEYLRIVRRFGGRRIFMSLANSQLSDQVFDARELFGFCERSPGGALAYLGILQEFDDEGLFGPSGRRVNFIDEVLESRRLEELLDVSPLVFAVWLRVARLTKSHRLVEMLDAYISGRRGRFGISSQIIDQYPISVFADFRWLARETGNQKFSQFLDKFVN